MSASPRSFGWALVRGLIIFEAVAVAFVILIAAALLWSSGLLIASYENGNVDVLRNAIGRDANGELVLVETPEVKQLRRDAGNVWFVVRDPSGKQLAQGSVPPAFAFATAGLQRMNDARLRLSPEQNARPEAVVKWVDSAAGRIQIFTGTEGPLTLRRFLLSTSDAFATIFIPMLLLLAFATIVVTPFVVKRALAGLTRAAAEAAQIKFEERGAQIPAASVPRDFLPLVNTVNDALGRLDQSYARHKRFLAQAAHELRTPIAILNARVASLPPGPDKTHLLRDSGRLATLAGQLLDMQRLDQETQPSSVDLGALAERVVIDLAPLAFAAGYEMGFERTDRSLLVQGDEVSLERAISNLVQNAIDHGGERGTITVRVFEPASVEVCDQGDGVPPDERKEVFEPFNRLHSARKGAGLGLNLVKGIVELHGGQVAITDSRDGGACFRIDLPTEKGSQSPLFTFWP